MMKFCGTSRFNRSALALNVIALASPKVFNRAATSSNRVKHQPFSGSRLLSSTVVCSSAPASSSEMAPSRVDAATIDRIRGALLGILIADSLSMPVHWYYNPNDIVRDFGTIKDYQAPKKTHPSSIMSLSNTGGHGRGGQSGRIVGDVINHGKHSRWGVSGVHYHEGMLAGENTLNALCSRLVVRTIAEGKGYNPAKFLEAYVKFMTTPGSHNDTYAESFHRDFFKNWAAGVPAEKCSLGTEGHNTAQIGGFVMLPPVILAEVLKGGSAEDAKRAAVTHLKLTHDSKQLWKQAEIYSDLLYSLVKGEDPMAALKKADEAIGGGQGMFGGRGGQSLALASQNMDDLNVVHRALGSACYIESSFPVVVYLAAKYVNDFEKAVLQNTNVGGENCHRGAALGAIMGAMVGQSKLPPRFVSGLNASADIQREIDAYVQALSE